MYIGESENVVVVKNFRTYLKDLGYSESTCYMLPECIKDFLLYSKTSLDQISSKHIQSFYEWLQIRPHKRKEGGLSEQYINHHVYALKTFFNWLEVSGAIESNPISALKIERGKSKERIPLTRPEINTLFNACKTLKETTVLHLFYSCGLRRSEGVMLNINDVRFLERLLYVRKGKGAKRRVVPLTKAVSHDFERYFLEDRLKAPAKDPEAFMVNTIGNRMRGDSYNSLLKKLLERAELPKEISLHHLRHSIATHLLESGLQVEQVREFLGHNHLESTQVYAKVSENQLGKL